MRESGRDILFILFVRSRIVKAKQCLESLATILSLIFIIRSLTEAGNREYHASNFNLLADHKRDNAAPRGMFAVCKAYPLNRRGNRIDYVTLGVSYE